MHHHVAQKIQQALQAALKPDPFEDRIKEAWMHLMIVHTDHYMATVSPELRAHFDEFEKWIEERNFDFASKTLFELIWIGAGESGHQDATEDQ